MYIELLKNRKSVRTFDETKKIDTEILNELSESINSFKNPFSDNICIKILNKNDFNLFSKVIKGEEYYIATKLKRDKNFEVAFGFELESILINLRKYNIESVFLASTYEKENFIKALDVKDDEIIPAVCPIGYKASESSIKDRALRRFCKSDTRKDIKDLLVNCESFTNDELEIFNTVLWAPSARNNQPLKIIKEDNYYHFYINHTKGFSNDLGDVQKIDLGIALANLSLAYKDYNKELEFVYLKKENLSDNCDYQISVKLA